MENEGMAREELPENKHTQAVSTYTRRPTERRQHMLPFKLPLERIVRAWRGANRKEALGSATMEEREQAIDGKRQRQDGGNGGMLGKAMQRVKASAPEESPSFSLAASGMEPPRKHPFPRNSRTRNGEATRGREVRDEFASDEQGTSSYISKTAFRNI
eukprot:TRINITY_DN9817_c0_g2_i1.p2 TRINITY_DN9817_c0_g2~~TRINITY_DN9817_c0_g2_i1.p2  ORF type:complete len:158 (+),score=22.67 TRINITY_DN9817_c0_g2_i1:392-865(+)